MIFICVLMLGVLKLAWNARGVLAEIEKQIAVKFSEFEKDIRHTKRSVEHHAAIGAELVRDITILQKDVERLIKLVNGK